MFNSKSVQHYSPFTDKGFSVAERVIRTIRILLKKPVFERGNANWLSELSAVINEYNISIHHSIKKTPIEASKKANVEEVDNILRDDRQKQISNFKLGQLVRTVDIERVYSKGDGTNW